MRVRAVLALMTTSVLCGCAVGFDEKEPFGANVVFGDSLAYGIGATPERVGRALQHDRPSN